MSNVKFHMLISLLILLVSCHAQSISASNSIINAKTFGFQGNGKTNNSVAFAKMSKWLSGKSNYTVVFDKGNYVVGNQFLGKKAYLTGQSMLVLNNCNNITVEGKGAKFIYQSGLKFGSFNPITGIRFIPKKKVFTDKKYAATVGSFILVVNSKNIRINNIKVDGNSKGLVKGGRWGDHGIQLDHTGCRIRLSTNISINNSEFNNFGLDGIYVHNKTPNGANTPSQEIKINNTICNYSGRQGMSWTGGSGLFINNCEFSYTGRGGMSSKPASGMDIEPNKGVVCTKATIKNTKFIGNVSSGFVSYHTGINKTFNVLIDDCVFVSHKLAAILPRNGGLTIKNSKIIGPCIGLRGNTNNPSIMENCYFTDSLITDKSPKYWPYLFNSNTSQNYTLRNCTFSMHRYAPIFISANASTRALMPLLDNNKFVFRYQDKLPKKWGAIIRNTRLNNNLFIDKTKQSKNFKFYLNTRTGEKQKNIYTGYNKIISTNQFGWNRVDGPKARKPSVNPKK